MSPSLSSEFARHLEWRTISWHVNIDGNKYEANEDLQRKVGQV